MPKYNNRNIIYNENILVTNQLNIEGVNYNIKESILFLQITSLKEESLEYIVQLSIKSPCAIKGKISSDFGQPLFIEPIKLKFSSDLVDKIGQFQKNRRSNYEISRHIINREKLHPEGLENELTDSLMSTFFKGDIHSVCLDFIKLLHNKKIQELLLVIVSESITIRNLPWEMLIHKLVKSESDSLRLANDNFGLIRTVEKTLKSFSLARNIRVSNPLKLLFITALPENLSERGKMLEIEDEQQKLIEAIGGLEALNQPKIVIEFLDNASLEEIDTALSARKHNIVHISGHGKFDTKIKQGILYLEDENGNENQVTGLELGELLSHHNKSIQLLILSACETAIAGDEGTCEQLAKTSGIPAILGMRFAVTDKGAKLFTTTFYKRLAKGESLINATAEAREVLWKYIRELRQKSPDNLYNAEWFTPVLYQNQYVGSLTEKFTYEESIRQNFYPKLTFLKGTHTRLIGEGFIGRKSYLIILRQAFSKNQHACLHGLGGLGKTTLSEAFSDSYRKRYGHQVFLFRGGIQTNEKLIIDRLFLAYSKAKPSDFALEELKAIINSDASDSRFEKRLI